MNTAMDSTRRRPWTAVISAPAQGSGPRWSTRNPSEPLGLEQCHAQVDEHGDGQHEKETLDGGHIRSSPRIRASMAATKTMIPAITSKSAMPKRMAREPVTARWTTGLAG